MLAVEIRDADLDDPREARAVVELIDGYAREESRDGRALPDEVRQSLVAGLAAHPTACVILAWRDGDPVGIAVGLCCSQLLLGNLYLLVIVESCNSCQLPLRRGYRLAVAKCLKCVQTRLVGEISSWQAIGPHCA